MIAYLVSQWLGLGLVTLWPLVVLWDHARPRSSAKGRYRVQPGQSPKRLPKLKNGERSSA